MAKKTTFRRPDGHKYSKLGVRRKKKQVYRKSKGTDNKIRLNKRNRPRNVRIGFKNKKTGRGLIKDMKVVQVYNVGDLKKIKENMIGIVSKVGLKKKKEIVDYASQHKIKLSNVDVGKFLKKFGDRMNKSKSEKVKRDQKMKVKGEKAKEKEEKDKKDVEKDEKKDAQKEEKKDEKKTEENLEGKVEDKKEEKKLTDDEKKVKQSKIKEKGK